MAVTKRQRLNGIINRVKLVGIELEGGWDAAPEGENIVKDGSVKFASPTLTASFEQLPDGRRRPVLLEAPVSVGIPAPPIKGEIVSPPIPMEKIPGWISHAYPKYVNETCGLHVHMSFGMRANYSRLMVSDFTPWMVKNLREWAETEKLPTDHPQWKRFNPKDPWTLQHCSHVYLGEEQAKMSRKDYESRGRPYSRYTFVNYCYSMPGINGPRATVEVRGLSMPDTPEVATRAVMAVIHATNLFLSKIKEKERPQHITISPRPNADQIFRAFAA